MATEQATDVARCEIVQGRQRSLSPYFPRPFGVAFQRRGYEK
jgi:hypothetical protein